MGIPIIKPHGSIDFDIGNSLITSPEIENNDPSLMKNYIIQTSNAVNGEIKVSCIDYNKRRYRLQPDIIPPNSENYNIHDIYWVKELEEEYKSLVKKMI